MLGNLIVAAHAVINPVWFSVGFGAATCVAVLLLGLGVKDRGDALRRDRWGINR